MLFKKEERGKEMKWLDSRLAKPTSNHFDTYFVTFLSSESVFLGFANWMPINGYTDGQWEKVRCTNGNPIDGEVLYWMPHPKRPELI
jgi:hypothetical protein